MQYAAAYFTALIVFGLIDAVWLSTMGPVLYRPQLGDILLQNIRVGPAIAFYAAFPVGLIIFAIAPALKTEAISTALIYGLLFGASTYATYDLTNFATLRNWTLQITVADIVYGAVASGVASAAAVMALRFLPPSLGGIAN